MTESPNINYSQLADIEAGIQDELEAKRTEREAQLREEIEGAYEDGELTAHPDDIAAASCDAYIFILTHSDHDKLTFARHLRRAVIDRELEYRMKL